MYIQYCDAGKKKIFPSETVHMPITIIDTKSTLAAIYQNKNYFVKAF